MLFGYKLPQFTANNIHEINFQFRLAECNALLSEYSGEIRKYSVSAERPREPV
jgi:hypothetical protein